MRDGWTETTLGNIAEVIMGRQLSPSKKLGTRPRPYLRAANIGNWGISLNDVMQMDFTEDEEKHFASRTGDVLMVEGGNEKSVGCPALVTEREQGICIQNTVIRCRVKDATQLTSEFLYHLLRHNFWVGKFGELCAGTTIMHLGQKRAVIFPLVVPPLVEQKRIVDVVSSVDSYIDALQQQADSARRARNAVLHELLSAGGDGWTETTLGEISELVSRGRAPSYCDDDGVVVLNQKCVRYGRIFFEFARRTDTTKKTIPEWAYLKVGDTLINSTGVGTLGRASFVSCLDGPTTFDSHVTLVRPRHDSSFPEFIGMTLNLLENEIEMFAGGSTGQTELSREAVNSFSVSLPPLEEQKRIVEIVSSMDEVIQSTEQAVTDAKNLRSGLLSDLLSGNHEIPASYDSLLGAA